LDVSAFLYYHCDENWYRTKIFDSKIKKEKNNRSIDQFYCYIDQKFATLNLSTKLIL